MAINKNVVHFIYELGQLSREDRSGWKKIMISNPEVVSGHVTRAAQIGYILAMLEGRTKQEAQTVACTLLFHDNTETRGGDRDRLHVAYYLNKTEVEERIHQDQVALLPEVMQDSYNEYIALFEGQSDLAIICHDADQLDCAFKAREYYVLGYAAAQRFVESTGLRLQTKSAITLFELMQEVDPIEWVRLAIEQGSGKPVII